MLEECRNCGEQVDVRPTAKGTRMAISLEKAENGSVELRESKIAGRGVVAVRVERERGDQAPRYVEHSKVCRGKKRGR